MLLQQRLQSRDLLPQGLNGYLMFPVACLELRKTRLQFRHAGTQLLVLGTQILLFGVHDTSRFTP
jgi:hypothetical protein